VADSLITIAAADEIAAEATSQAGARVKAASITMAEAQVLRYLPHHCPSPLSPQARHLPVRSQGASGTLYARLGVHSRMRQSAGPILGLIRAR